MGTVGQQKAAATIMPAGTQIVIGKDELDPFNNREFAALLDRLDIDDCVVYGVLLEYCVKYTLMGLLARGRKVSLVEDATAWLSESEGLRVLQEFKDAGGVCIDIATALR